MGIFLASVTNNTPYHYICRCGCGALALSSIGSEYKGDVIICAQKGGQPIMSDYNHDQDPYDYDDDERFYEETVYNEEYYIEQERELIRQSNLELELEELEERHIREMREECLLLPVKPGESNSEDENESPLDQPEIEL